MSRIQALSLTTAIALALFSEPACLFAAEKKSKQESVDCLVIEQSDLKMGKIKILLGKNCARVDAMNGQATVIAKAPTWDVVVFNRDREFFPISRSDWHEHGIVTMVKNRRRFFTGATASPVPLVFMGKQSLRATQFSPNSGVTLDSFFQTPQAKGAGEAKVTFTATSNLGLSKDASAFIEGLYLTAPCASVMLDTTAIRRGKEEHWLETNSIAHKSIPKSMFVVPSGLHKAQSMTAVVTGKGIEEMMLNFSGAK